MSIPLQLKFVSIKGIRAFLKLKEIDLSKRPCLMIYSENGCGKSSVIDGLEAFFSESGTLDRLGKRKDYRSNKAGPTALIHNLAEEENIVPSVSIELNTVGSKPIERIFTKEKNKGIPESAKTLTDCFSVNPIIRGFDLRGYIENTKTEERYDYVASCLQFGALVESQKFLRRLRKLLNSDLKKKQSFDEINDKLSELTEQQLNSWNESKVIEYINKNLLSFLNLDLELSKLNTKDKIYQKISEFVEDENNRVGLTQLQQIRDTINLVYSETSNEENGEVLIQGFLSSFVSKITELAIAKANVEKERDKAEKVIFKQVWEEAKSLFEGKKVKIDNCPVCQTPIDKTKLGSSKEINHQLTMNLEKLAAYSEVVEEFESVSKEVVDNKNKLLSNLQILETLLESGFGDIALELKKIIDDFKRWTKSVPPDTTNLVSLLKSAQEEVCVLIDKITAKQGDFTYSKVKSIIDKLIELKMKNDFLIQILQELKSLLEAFDIVEKKVSDQISKKIISLLDKIQNPMNEIYSRIQGDLYKKVHLQLPPTSKDNKQLLNLLIDFDSNRPEVQPSGYLSDSQIHTLAIAFRLATIIEFNSKAPILILDDIVTSYDINYRRIISSLISKLSDKFQIIITTHDEHFNSFMKEMCDHNRWQFLKIQKIVERHGPKFEKSKTTDDIIEDQWDRGLRAANYMRQAIEEWLTVILDAFCIQVIYKKDVTENDYTRVQKAEALGRFLKNSKLSPKKIDGFHNSYVESLKKASIENFGSHFDCTNRELASIGDEKERWREFTNFRDQFVCKKCKDLNRIEFNRKIDDDIPNCKKCGTPFEF